MPLFSLLFNFRYIINSVKPPTETIIYCIEILTRLARDSEFIVNKMIQTEVLLSSLVKYFMPPTKSMGMSQEGAGYNMPLPQMVKLLTVLSSRSRTLAQQLLAKHNLLDIVLAYLYDDYFAQNVAGMRLQVECFHYWTVLIHYGLASDSIRWVKFKLNILCDQKSSFYNACNFSWYKASQYIQGGERNFGWFHITI